MNKLLLFVALLLVVPAFAETSPKPEGSIECAVCEWMVGELDKWIEENSTQHEIEVILEKICTLIPKSLTKMCDKFIEEYTPVLIDMFVKDVPPEKICHFMHLCKTQATASLECTVCQWVLEEIEGFITKNSTEQEIVRAVEKVCDHLPSFLAGPCKELVEEYGPQIIQLLVDKENPQTVCTQLGLCKKAVKEEVTIQCSLCKWILVEVESWIASNTTEQEIIHIVEGICKYAPKSLTQTCTEFIDEYGQLIIDMLIQKLDPNEICVKLGLCKTATSNAAPVVENSIQCAICEWAMTELDTLIEKNATEAAIAKALEKVCEFLPSSVRSLCDSLIEEYTPMLIDMLVKRVPPQKICAALGLCPKHAPAATPAPENSQIECALCEWVMVELEKLVEGNSTETAIEHALEKVCGLLPKSVAGMCKSLVDEYTPVIIEMLVKKVPVQKICQMVGLCPKQAPAANGIQCAVCEWVVTELESLITKNASESAIEKALEKVCGLLPTSVRSMCDEFVEQYTPILVELLVKQVPPQKICTVIGLCGKTQAVVEENTIQCAICEWVLTELESLLTKNATEAEITKALEKVCDLLPSSVRSMCNAFVEEYTPILVELLVKEVDPAKICSLIGLCPKMAAPVPASNSIECAVCEWVMSELESLLTKNASETEIEKLLTQVCGYLPASLSGVCKDFVAEYTPILLELLVKQVPPAKVCTVIGLCGKTEAPKTNSIECAVCEWVMSELESLITKNASESAIEKALEKVCDMLPSAVRSLCKSLVEEYTPMIVELLVKQVPPQKVCAALGLCGKRAAVAENSIQCTVCEWVAAELEGLVQKNATETEIAKFLEGVCNYLPASLRAMCDSFVEEYTPMLIDLLVKKVPPQKLCQMIGLCGKTVSEPVPENSIQCAVCQWVITELETLLTKNATESEIEKALGKVCGLLPTSVRSMCNAFVEEYTPILVELLVKQVPPAKICTVIGLCGKTRVTGAMECTVCQFLVAKVDDLLKGDRSVQAIEMALGKVCGFLPASVRDLCTQFVTEYTPALVTLLVKELDPAKICGLIGACPKSAALPEGSIECALCEWVLTEIDNLLLNNRTEAAIEAALEKVCGLLPKSMVDVCDDFVDTYGPALIELIAEKMQPAKTCTFLGMCKQSPAPITVTAA